MTLVSDSMDVLEERLRILHTTYSGMGLSISSRKSKIVAVCPSSLTSIQPSTIQLTPGEEPVSVVEDFQYLGCVIPHDCLLDQEISMCISKASQTFCSLCKVLTCQKDGRLPSPLESSCWPARGKLVVSGWSEEKMEWSGDVWFEELWPAGWLEGDIHYHCHVSTCHHTLFIQSIYTECFI